MKSEHRHELETNVLSKELAVWIERVKPHTNAIVGALAILVGAYLAASWWSASRAARDRQFWEEMQMRLGATDREYEELRRLAVSEDYAGASGQEWAYITWADRQLLIASQEYLQYRNQAMERLSNVAGVYDTLATSATSEEVANRARFGLARVYEMQNKPDAAQRQYGMVRGALSELAIARAKQLESQDNRGVAEWLATAELPAPSATRDSAGAGGGVGSRPDFDVDLPPALGGEGKTPNKLCTLEEILGDVTAGESEEDRYGESEGAEPEGSDAGNTSQSDEEPRADSTTDDASADDASADGASAVETSSGDGTQ